MKEKKVERAVILAAGLGTRMSPVTDNLPKPLVKVSGRRIIETLLDALKIAEINDIYIVCGYLAEKFNCLKDKYPNLKFITNKYYRDANNISSVLCAKNLIKNAYIIEGDLFLKNPALISPNQSESNYLAIYTKQTDDWCFKLGNDGYINKIEVGGRNCYQMVGISYWTEKDGEKLARHIEKVFSSPDGKNKYWDEVALSLFLPEYKIKIRECFFEDVIEIDTLEELKKLDSSYL